MPPVRLMGGTSVRSILHPAGAASGADLTRRSGAVEALADLSPVDHAPERFDEIGAPVLVLQVVSVLPDVEDQQSRLRGSHHVVILQVDDFEFAARAVPGQRHPAAGEMFRRRLTEPAAEFAARAEVRIDSPRERALWCL